MLGVVQGWVGCWGLGGGLCSGRDVPADTFLVLFSEAAGVDAVSDQIYWPDPASEFLYLPAVCGFSTRNWKA